jgi:hypothetical protein
VLSNGPTALAWLKDGEWRAIRLPAVELNVVFGPYETQGEALAAAQRPFPRIEKVGESSC